MKKPKYHLAIDDNLVKSNVLYIYPKASAIRVDPPEKCRSRWFTYSSKKEFYPIVIYKTDVDGLLDHFIDPKRIVSMTLKCIECENEDDKPDPFTLDCVHLKGVYWFQATRFHIVGKFLMTFSSNAASSDDYTVEELQFEITVTEKGVASKKKIVTSAEVISDDAAKVALKEEEKSQEKDLVDGTQGDKANQDKDADAVFTETKRRKSSSASISASKSSKRARPSHIKTPSKEESKAVPSPEADTEILSSEPELASAESPKPVRPPETERKSRRIRHEVVMKEDTVMELQNIEKEEKEPQEHEVEKVKGEVVGGTEVLLVAQHDVEILPQSKVAPKNIISTFSAVLPYPSHPLNCKYRLEPPPLAPSIPSPGSTSSGALALPIKGPLLSYNLPQSLVRVLLADQVTHEKLCEFLRHSLKKGLPLRSLKLPAPLRSPSVLDLLEELKAACEVQLQATVLQLQYLFEHILHDKLLYPFEMKTFGARIASLQNSKKILASEFGPYHYLRFLIFVIREADLTEENAAGDHRLKLQQVIDTAIKILDDKAHVIFY